MGVGHQSGIQPLSLFPWMVIILSFFLLVLCANKAFWFPDANELRTFLLFQVQGGDFSSSSLLSPSGGLISSQQPVLMEPVRAQSLWPCFRLSPASFAFSSHFWLWIWPPVWMPDSVSPGNCSAGISFCFLNMTFNYTRIIGPSAAK